MSRYSPTVTPWVAEYHNPGSAIADALQMYAQHKERQEQQQYERRRDTVHDGGEVDPLPAKGPSALSRIGRALGIGRPRAPEMPDIGAQMGGIHDAVNGSFVAETPDAFDPWAAYDAGRGTPPLLPGNRGSHGGSAIGAALRTAPVVSPGDTTQPPVAPAAPSGPVPRPGRFDASSGVFNVPGAPSPRPARPSWEQVQGQLPTLQMQDVAPGMRLPSKASQDARAYALRGIEGTYGDQVADWTHGRDRGEALGDRDDTRRYTEGQTAEQRKHAEALAEAAHRRALAIERVRQANDAWQPRNLEEYRQAHGVGEARPGATNRPLPAAATAAVVANRVGVRAIDEAIAAVDRNPGAFGMSNAGPGSWLKDHFAPDSAHVDARARVGDLGSLKIHDRTGAAMGQHEWERLKAFIPTANDRPDVAKWKLQQLREHVVSETEALQDIYGARLPEGAFGGAATTSRAPLSDASKQRARTDARFRDFLAEKGYGPGDWQ